MNDQELKKEAKQIKEEIIDIHKQSNSLIFHREDPNEPLNTYRMRKMEELNSRCDKLQNRLKSIEIQLKKITSTPMVSLTPKEFMLLGQLVNAKLAEGLTPTELRRRFTKPNKKMGRGYIQDNLRKFLIAGLVIASKAGKYVITVKGSKFYEEQKAIKE